MDVGNRRVTPVIQPKKKGAVVMVSDFMEQHQGFLCITEEEHTTITPQNPEFPITARVMFEYGAEKEGCWTGEILMCNVKDVCKIAEHKYPAESHTVMWFFDQSSCHRAFADNALNVR